MIKIHRTAGLDQLGQTRAPWQVTIPHFPLGIKGKSGPKSIRSRVSSGNAHRKVKITLAKVNLPVRPAD